MNLMNWNKCEKEFIKKITPDKERIESIMEVASNRLKTAKIMEAELNEDNVSFVIEEYYEIIKELLTAFLLKEGLKSKNHQCLISYFYKKYPDHEFEADLISQMSYLRNRLNYYGESIDMTFYEKNKENIIKIIEMLQKIIRTK
jgi:uncharacterized protein (UPF0332 family)